MTKTTGGATTRYLHSGSDEIAEYDNAGNLLRRFVPGAGVDERAAWIESGAAAPPASAIFYPHADRLGSVMAISNSTGAVTARFAYDAFGLSNSSSAGYPFRFTGQRLDPESGLMFYKARIYSTALGRFLQTDPIGTKDDFNLYAYAGNHPVVDGRPPPTMTAGETTRSRRCTGAAVAQAPASHARRPRPHFGKRRVIARRQIGTKADLAQLDVDLVDIGDERRRKSRL